MADPPPDGTTSTARIVELLAPTLGWEKASEIVAAAQVRLGLVGSTLTFENGLTVLDELGRTPGMVGISARFARSRLEAPRAPVTMRDTPKPPARSVTMGETPKPPARPVTMGEPSKPPARPGTVGETSKPARPVSGEQPIDSSAKAPPSGKPGGAAVTVEEIAGLLTSALGADKAHEVVLAAVRRLGLSREHLDRNQAMALLDDLAVEPGVVGLCARFGKARLILRFAA